VVLDLLDSEDGKVRVTLGKVVMKEFLGGDAVDRVNKLTEIYKLLKDKRVPNVDGLDTAEIGVRRRVFLSPVGLHVYPSSGEQAFDAVFCVLQALKVRYDVSVFII